MSKIKKTKRVEIWNKFGQRCAYCGCVLEYNKMQVDHIAPIFRGSSQKELDYYSITKGTNKIHNLNPSCGSCNSSKSTFTIEQWRSEIEKKTNRIRRDVSTFRILERFGIIKVIKSEVNFYFESYGRE